MSQLTDITLTERADSAFASGQLDRALRGYTMLLEADPSDLYVWYRTAVTLAKMGDREVAKRSLEAVSIGFAEAGQLLLALAATKDLEPLSAEMSKERVATIAELYGSGSQRIDRRRPPPQLPAPAQTVPTATDVADARVLRVMAADACDQALSASDRSGSHEPLPFHPLLSDLAAKAMVELVPLLELSVHPAGDVVIEQGDEGRSLFIVVRGTAEVSADGVHLAYLRSGAFFGEMALLSDSPRAARVSCYTPLVLFEVGREALEKLAAADPMVATVLATHTRERLLRNLMATSELFRPLDPRRRSELVGLFLSRVFAPGEVVLREGDSSEGLYVVLSGRVKIEQQEQQEKLELAGLGPGQVFGEISLLQRRDATATVRAEGKTVVLLLPRDAFIEHVGAFPEVLAHIYKLATEREQSNLQVREIEPLAIEDDLLI